MSEREIRIRLFAGLRDAFGANEVSVPASEAGSAADLLAHLSDRHPAAAALLGGSRVAVDREFAAPDSPIPSGAEVAVIPPVSGG